MMGECTDAVIVLRRSLSSMSKAMLTIRNITRAHEGTYICKGKSSRGEDMSAKRTIVFKEGVVPPSYEDYVIKPPSKTDWPMIVGIIAAGTFLLLLAVFILLLFVVRRRVRKRRPFNT